jgi:hypothetical protein
MRPRVRVSTSCEKDAGDPDDGEPAVIRDGTGHSLRPPARASFATVQSACIACAAVPALSRTSAVIFSVEASRGKGVQLLEIFVRL